MYVQAGIVCTHDSAHVDEVVSASTKNMTVLVLPGFFVISHADPGRPWTRVQLFQSPGLAPGFCFARRASLYFGSLPGGPLWQVITSQDLGMDCHVYTWPFLLELSYTS